MGAVVMLLLYHSWGCYFPPDLGWNHTVGITKKRGGDRDSLWLQIHLSLGQRPGVGLDCIFISTVFCYIIRVRLCVRYGTIST